MAWLDEVGAVLSKYAERTGRETGSEVETHFNQVATAAPSEELSRGITEAFRSDNTPPFADMITQLFERSSPVQKSNLVNLLLSALGSSGQNIMARLGLNGIANGNQVAPEQAQTIEPQKVQELAAQAEKKDPTVLEQAGEFYSQHPSLVRSLGSAALAIVLAKIARSTRAM